MRLDERTHKYDDIIDLPHPVSLVHPPMTRLDRAAQFSPFAALTGHGDAIKEEARETSERLELDENQKEWLNERLNMLREQMSEHPRVSITYFLPDERKQGGIYKTFTGYIDKWEMYKRELHMGDGTVIPIEEIYDLEGTIFNYVRE